MSVQVEGRPDIIIDLKDAGALDGLKDKPFTIKEGSKFRMKANFKVQHQILSGLKYVQVVKRMGVSNKMQEMIVSRNRCSCINKPHSVLTLGCVQGSYSPNTKDKPQYEKKCMSFPGLTSKTI